MFDSWIIKVKKNIIYNSLWWIRLVKVIGLRGVEFDSFK